MLTCDDSPQCREIFSGYPALQVSMKHSLGNSEGKDTPDYHELIVLHPAIALKDTDILPFKRSCQDKRKAA
jgi:hypothetical protein